jgi:hypothetical protein
MKNLCSLMIEKFSFIENQESNAASKAFENSGESTKRSRLSSLDEKNNLEEFRMNAKSTPFALPPF